MQIHISSRHLKLTGAIQAYVAQKVSNLEHLTEDIIGAHVVLMHDENKTPARAFSIKIHLGVPGPDIFIEEYNADMYAGIDLATEKLARMLRKRKTRKVTHKKNLAQRAREAEKRGLRR